MKISPIKLALILFPVVVTTGCASAAQSTSAQPVPEGVYRSSNGVVELGLTKGHWFISHGQFNHVEEGSYSFSGSQMKFSLEKASPDDECDPSEKTFTYQWSFDGKALTLTKPDDKCVIRVSDLSNNPLAYGTATQ